MSVNPVQNSQILKLMRELNTQFEVCKQKVESDPANLANILELLCLDPKSYTQEVMRGTPDELNSLEGCNPYTAAMFALDYMITLLENAPSVQCDVYSQNRLLNWISEQVNALLNVILTNIEVFHQDPTQVNLLRKYQQLLVTLYPYLMNTPLDDTLKATIAKESQEFFAQEGTPLQLPTSPLEKDLIDYQNILAELEEISHGIKTAVSNHDVVELTSLVARDKELSTQIDAHVIVKISPHLLQEYQKIQSLPESTSPEEKLSKILQLLRCLYVTYTTSVLRTRMQCQNGPQNVKPILYMLPTLMDAIPVEKRAEVTPFKDRFISLLHEKIAEMHAIAPNLNLPGEEKKLSDLQEEISTYLISLEIFINEVSAADVIDPTLGESLSSGAQQLLDILEEHKEEEPLMTPRLRPIAEKLKSLSSLEAVATKEDLLAKLQQIGQEISIAAGLLTPSSAVSEQVAAEFQDLANKVDELFHNFSL